MFFLTMLDGSCNIVNVNKVAITFSPFLVIGYLNSFFPSWFPRQLVFFCVLRIAICSLSVYTVYMLYIQLCGGAYEDNHYEYVQIADL